MSIEETYQIGDAPVITINTFDVAGTPADPTGLNVKIQRAGAAAITYTYPSAELTKTSTGIYKLAHPALTVAGVYQVKPTATGANASSLQSSFKVEASNIT